MLNLVGTGEGTLPPGANPAGTFIDITGGLAMIDPSGPNPQLLLLDSAGAVVHEIDPVSGVSNVSYTPLSGMVANIPDKDLRKLQTANAFLIIPAALKGQGSMKLFSTHPPLQERIKRLRELEQRMKYGMR